jgi:acetyl esterase/lipase
MALTPGQITALKNLALKQAGKEVTLVEYRGAGHYMYGPWTDSIRQVERFLDKHL